jgi:glutamate synthase domain-containing protein 2
MTPKMTVKEFMQLTDKEQKEVLAQMGFKSLSKASLKRGVAGKNF